MNENSIDHSTGLPQEQAHINAEMTQERVSGDSRPTLSLPSPETASAAYMHITNVIALVLAVYIAYETKQALTPHIGNIPVLIAGSFPIVASSAIAVLTFFSERDSLLRIFYLMGIYTSSWMGV